MRFADMSPTTLAVLLCCAGVAGCASLFGATSDPSVPSVDAAASAPAVVPADAAASAAKSSPKRAAPGASAPVAAAAASAASAVATEPQEAPVPPAAQRAFDDARRAMRQGRVEEAERGLRGLIQFHPELGGPHANLGLLLRQAGKLPEAVVALEAATRASPRQATYFNQLGVTYRQQGQFAKAREAYEKAISLAPEYPAPVLNLGILHDLYLWDGKRAMELYDRYLALTPGGDATVTKWVADLKNRKPAQAAPARKEKE